ncbi:hypothetical protein ACCD10_31020 [Pseudomonas sp. Pseusp122]|uniref:hypothetical protein n=1 Tax=unclassified Pseudomonas TaxID=196821 RepID=UPI0039A6D0BA
MKIKSEKRKSTPRPNALRARTGVKERFQPAGTSSNRYLRLSERHGRLEGVFSAVFQPVKTAKSQFLLLETGLSTEVPHSEPAGKGLSRHSEWIADLVNWISIATWKNPAQKSDTAYMTEPIAQQKNRTKPAG